MNRLVRVLLLSAYLLSSAAAATAQLPPVPSPPLRDAYYAMSEGRYGEALEAYLRILEVARDTTLIAEIASQTGELYRVTEVAPDGRGLEVSSDGGLLAFNTEGPDGNEVQVFRIEPTEAGMSSSLLTTLDGSRFALTSEGAQARAAYLTPGDASAIEGIQLQMERARQRQSSLEFLASRRQLEWVEVTTAELRVRDLVRGTEVTVALEDRIPIDWTFDDTGSLVVLAASPGSVGSGVFRTRPDGVLERIDAFEGYMANVRAVSGGHVVVDTPIEDPAPHEPGAAPSPPLGRGGFATVNLETGDVIQYEGTTPTVSDDGNTIAFFVRPDGFEPDRIRYPHGPGGELRVARVGQAESTSAWTTDRPIRSASLSPDGSWVAYAEMLDRNWEVFVRPTRGSERARRVTNEIQHDLNPAFLGRGTLLATKGESRHRRSYLYDFAGGPPLKLFDNNVLRTITPEYEWALSPSGDWIAIVAERDGDTVSPERGVYLVDLTRRVGRAEVRARLQADLDRERHLQALGSERFAPIHDSVEVVVSKVSVAKIYEYERVLHSFGSKFVTEPGNRLARDYLVGALRSFGYSPVLQEFEARPGVRSANVIATLPGTEDPDLIYVISSHFDSSIRGAGADDNTSGTAALLEAARVLADNPQRATIQFVFLTGEEAGLLGARHFVSVAQATGVQIGGVLNNDMVGWSNDHRLDNTIRYSSAGIRDIQHAAASRYSDLITYDAKYYKNTDAHAFFDGYGDIVGGIGSYPVLGNPNYHQATDRLETINHRLVAEVGKTTVATIMALAYGPARPSGLTAQTLADGGTRLGWSAYERAVRSYRVRYRTGESSDWVEVNSQAPLLELPALPDGTEIEVVSIGREGMTSWDAARLVLGEPRPN